MSEPNVFPVAIAFDLCDKQPSHLARKREYTVPHRETSNGIVNELRQADSLPDKKANSKCRVRVEEKFEESALGLNYLLGNPTNALA
jgi:hypothetical protein